MTVTLSTEKHTEYPNQEYLKISTNEEQVLNGGLCGSPPSIRAPHQMPTIMPLTVEIQTKRVCSRGRVVNYPKEIVKK